MRWIAALGLAAQVSFAATDAQEAKPALRSGLSPPVVLDEMKRAAGQCRRDDVVEQRANGTKVQTESLRRAAACRLDALEVSKLMGRPESQLIDLRPRGQFEMFRIAASIPATVHELRVKPYWRAKHVVLLGDGRREEDLYRICASLLAGGYKRVSVLGGGLGHWAALGLPLTGQVLTDLPLRLSAEELWVESLYEHNAVFVEQGQDALVSELPRAAGLIDFASEGALALAVRRWQSQRRHLFLSSVIIVVQPGTPRARIASMQRQLLEVPLLVHEGTAAPIKAIAPRLQRIWAAHVRGPQQPSCGG